MRDVSVVGGADSVVTSEPPQAASARASPTQSCRDDEGGPAQPGRHHEPGPPTLVPRSQLMEARASAVVQSGAWGCSRSCTPPSSSREVSLGLSLPLEVRRGGVDEALAAVRVDEDVAVGVVDVVGERLRR